MIKKIARLVSKYPYIAPLLAGIVLYLFVIKTNDSFSNLLLNVSASLITIPLVIFTYEKVRDRATRERDRDVSNYVKMNVDREFLSLLNRVSPLVVKTPTPGLEKVLVLLQMTREDMENSLSKYNPIVYFLSTDWGFSEDKFAEILSNEIIYNNLSIDERNMLIRLVSATRMLEAATNPRFYKPHGKPDSKYSILDGNQIDRVSKFHNRYLLMTKSKKVDHLVVAAFNDIKQGKYKEDLLTPMKPNAEGKQQLVAAVSEVIACLNQWLDSRGDEFILDGRNFKIRRKRTEN